MQEAIGPFHSDRSEPDQSEPATTTTTTYPTFVRGKIQDMRYYKDPLERTLFYVQGCDTIQQSTVVGRIVPEGELPSDLHLSQLSQEEFSQEDHVQGFLENTQAYTLLYPTFKQIICLAQGDRKLAALSYDTLKGLHKPLLKKLAPANSSEANKENAPPNGFRSSNLEVDMYAKSNKRIRPRGEHAGNSSRNTKKKL
jgi:hypothetical protein